MVTFELEMFFQLDFLENTKKVGSFEARLSPMLVTSSILNTKAVQKLQAYEQMT